MWPISMPRASVSGPEPSGEGSPSRISATSITPSAVKSRPAVTLIRCVSATLAPVAQEVPSTTRGSTRYSMAVSDSAPSTRVPSMLTGEM